MALRFLCPNCHRELEVPDEAAGTAGQCRLCGAAIIAPAAPGQPAALAQPPGAPPVPGGTPSAVAPYGRVEPFRIVTDAWQTLWRHFAPIAVSCYIVGAVCAVVGLFAAGPLIGTLMMSDPSSAPLRVPWHTNLLFMGIAVVLAPLTVGPLYVVDEVLTHGYAEISTMFRGFRQFRDIALFVLITVAVPNLLQNLPTSGMDVADLPLPLRLWTIACGILIVFINVTILPGIMEIVDRGADTMSAIRASWEFTRGHRWMILLTGIVVYIVGVSGAIACGIGLLLTAPLIPAGFVILYRDLRGLRGGAPGV